MYTSKPPDPESKQLLLLSRSWQKYIDAAHLLWHQSCNYTCKCHRKVALNLLDAEEWWLRCIKYPVFWGFCEHLTGKKALCHHLLVSWRKILIPKQFIHIYTYSEIFQLIRLGETYKRRTSTWPEVKIIQEKATLWQEYQPASYVLMNLCKQLMLRHLWSNSQYRCISSWKPRESAVELSLWNLPTSYN